MSGQLDRLSVVIVSADRPGLPHETPDALKQRRPAVEIIPSPVHWAREARGDGTGPSAQSRRWALARRKVVDPKQ